MRGMRPIAQRVDDQRADAAHERPRRVWNAAAIGQVSKCSDAEAQDRPLPVQNRYRNELHAAERKRAANAEQRQLRNASAGGRRRIENVLEGAPQVGECPLVGEARNRTALHSVVAPNLVQPHHMIGVAVREEDGVDSADVVRKRLGAQIRRRVDEHVLHRARDR